MGAAIARDLEHRGFQLGWGLPEKVSNPAAQCIPSLIQQAFKEPIRMSSRNGAGKYEMGIQSCSH